MPTVKLIYNNECIKSHSLLKGHSPSIILKAWARLYPKHKFIDCKVEISGDVSDFVTVQDEPTKHNNGNTTPVNRFQSPDKIIKSYYNGAIKGREK